MKKTLLVLAAVIIALSLAGPVMAAAKDMKGMLGIGYFNPNAPVGVRLWFTEKIGVDVGLGIVNQPAGDPDATKKTEFTIDAGVPWVLAGTENTLFYFRPGFAYDSTPYYGGGEFLTAKTIWVRGNLAVEHFFGEHFSLQAAHGIFYQSYDSGVSGAKKISSFRTEAIGITNIGFHYYFKVMEK